MNILLLIFQFTATEKQRVYLQLFEAPNSSEARRLENSPLTEETRGLDDTSAGLQADDTCYAIDVFFPLVPPNDP